MTRRFLRIRWRGRVTGPDGPQIEEPRSSSPSMPPLRAAAPGSAATRGYCCTLLAVRACQRPSARRVSAGGRNRFRTCDHPLVRRSLPDQEGRDIRSYQARDLRKGIVGADIAMTAAVPTSAGLCRFVRGYFVGAGTENPHLWGFCGDANRRVMAGLPVLRSAAPGARSRQHRRPGRAPVRTGSGGPRRGQRARLDADPREPRRPPGYPGRQRGGRHEGGSQL
ncbi:MAG: hypothetical protein JWM19_4894 [Actinomycetia bacterium]|nr:hypothetical protein [Actinomycetes bacterium]